MGKIPAHRHLIGWALAKGWTVEAEDYDDQDWDGPTKMVEITNYSAAVDYVEAVDGGLSFYLIKRSTDLHQSDQSIWVCLAIGYGNTDEETVANYSVHPFMDIWNTEYDKYLQ